MSNFSTTIEILAVENEEKTSARTGNKYVHFAARSVLRSDDGGVVTVGTLRSRQIVPDLRDKVVPGIFKATFTLQVPDYGDNKGDIMAMLTGLVPVPVRAAPAPAPVAPAKA